MSAEVGIPTTSIRASVLHCAHDASSPKATLALVEIAREFERCLRRGEGPGRGRGRGEHQPHRRPGD